MIDWKSRAEAAELGIDYKWEATEMEQDIKDLGSNYPNGGRSNV